MTKKEKEIIIVLTQTIKTLQECMFKINERLNNLEKVEKQNEQN
tara:strand:- start:338 stop:469 length:132 start_codon:yes stop_codon:yes gene_type:complete